MARIRKTAQQAPASDEGDVTQPSSSPETRPSAHDASGITPSSRTVDSPVWTGASFTPEQRVAAHESICELISEGTPSRAACKEAGISRGTWRRWMEDGMVDRALYTRAREACADALGEGIIEVADNQRYDAQERRVMVDARKWVASRMYPKTWGDKVDVTSDGKSIGPIAALPASVLITGGENGEV